MGRRPEQRNHTDTGDPRPVDVMPVRSGSHPPSSPARLYECEHGMALDMPCWQCDEKNESR
jgi:hypothetical protein